MEDIKMIKCPDCGVVYPEKTKHKCDIKVLHGYQSGLADMKTKALEVALSVRDNTNHNFNNYIYTTATEIKEEIEKL